MTYTPANIPTPRTFADVTIVSRLYDRWFALVHFHRLEVGPIVITTQEAIYARQRLSFDMGARLRSQPQPAPRPPLRAV